MGRVWVAVQAREEERPTPPAQALMGGEGLSHRFAANEAAMRGAAAPGRRRAPPLNADPGGGVARVWRATRAEGGDGHCRVRPAGEEERPSHRCAAE